MGIELLERVDRQHTHRWILIGERLDESECGKYVCRIGSLMPILIVSGTSQDVEERCDP